MIFLEQDKLFTRQTLLLVPFGLLLNILLAKLSLVLHLPIFLDSIGTIYAAALGGLLPGITVGFFSNAFNSIGDPITLYYGLISILFAVAASFLSRRGAFCRYGTTLLSTLVFAVLGGLVGSLLTWMLSGLDIGTGISAGYVNTLIGHGFNRFAAQLSADFLIDLADKILTLSIVFLFLRLTPARILSCVPLGSMYLSGRSGPDKGGDPNEGSEPDA